MPSLRLLLGAIATEPLLDVLVAAGLTWAAHSSVAVVLLVMSLAAKGTIPPDAAFALVLGANLGTAINPVLEGASGDDPVARRLPLGNLLNRALGCVVALALLGRIGTLMVQFEPDPARAVADFHTGFNLLVAAVFLPLLGPFAWVLRRLLPARVAADDPSRPLYLDEAALRRRRRSRWPGRHARRCAWPMRWRPCWAGPARSWAAPTAAGSARCGGWTTCWTG